MKPNFEGEFVGPGPHFRPVHEGRKSEIRAYKIETNTGQCQCEAQLLKGSSYGRDLILGLFMKVGRVKLGHIR